MSLARMVVKIEHTVGSHNHDILQQCIYDVYASRNIFFCPSKLICIYEKIKINFVVFSVIFFL